MRKVILIGIGALALAAPAAAGPSTLVVSMRDPGCHWFHVGGKYVKSYSHHGAVQLLNQDEAALIVKGPRRHEARQGRREADPEGEGPLQDHDGQAGARRQPSPPDHQVTRA
jgi:hypothetical protein